MVLDNIFYTPTAYLGKKILKLVEVAGDPYTVVGISGATSNIQAGRFPASFLIPDDDPQYDKEGSTALGMYGYMLNSRCWIYDAGLALLVYTTAGQYDKCKEMLDRLNYEQNADGSWNFSFDLYIGQLFEDYVRTGSVGWLVWGICYYVLQSGDNSYNEMLRRAGDFILSMQVLDSTDPRYGLLLGGYGAYNMADYSYIDIKIEWCSTEHNCSTLQALIGLSLVFGEDRYCDAIQLVKDGLINTLYDFTEKRFYQGVSKDGVDKAWALDCTTWTGKMALSVVNDQIAKDCFQTTEDTYLVTNIPIIQSDQPSRYNMRYTSDHLFSGFKPYSDKTPDYEGAPNLVWSEGTLGAVALALFTENYTQAKKYMDEMVELQNIDNSSGGILYTTATQAELPWEFHAWESVVSSSWFYLLVYNPHVLFPITLKYWDMHYQTREFKDPVIGTINPIIRK